jgi:hypothetical protein
MTMRALVATAVTIAGLVALLASMPGSIAASRAGRILSSAELATCVNKGGSVKIAGLSGNQTCALPLADAGKQCTSSSQCLGDCLLDEARPGQRSIGAGAMVVGQCQATDYGFGCRTFVENGRVAQRMCID